MSDKKTSTFESDLKRLEEIVAKLEIGADSLEENLQLFEEGQQLLRKLRMRLEEAQVKVKMLLNSGEQVDINTEDLS